MAGIAQLDPNGHKSLTMWKEKLEARGYSVLYEPVSAQAQGENSYVFAVVSPWQKKVRLLQNMTPYSTHTELLSVTAPHEVQEHCLP